MIGAASELHEPERNAVPPALALLASCLWTGRGVKWMTVPSLKRPEKDSYQMLSPAKSHEHCQSGMMMRRALGSKGLAFNMKLQGRDVTSWGQATCFSVWKTVSINFSVVYECTYYHVQSSCFPWSIWVSYYKTAHCQERTCKKKSSRNSSRSALGMLADGQWVADTGDSIPLTLQRCQCLTRPLESVNKM